MSADEVVQIRRAGPEDCAAVAQVLARSFAEFRAQYTDAAFRATTPGAAEITERLAQGPTWIAIQGASVVGTASGVLHNDGLYVRSMAVLPEGRGHGVGRRLLEHAEAFAAAHACRLLELSTTPFLLQAIRLYERFGFRACGTTSLHGTPLVLMEKLVGGEPERNPPRTGWRE